MDAQKEKAKPKLPLMEHKDATLEELLQAGVHFGHQTHRWNPAMRDFIYTSRDGIHIIDLVKTIDSINEALEAVYTYASKGEVLFVGIKTQAKDIVKDAAVKTKSHFVVNRWPGGLLTNYLVTRKSIKKLNDLFKGFREGIDNRTKKEMLGMKKELERLEFLYGGVKQFNKKPACLIAVDSKKSRIAIREAHKMGIPVIAIVDTNSSPEMVDYVIPANDDSLKSIELIISKLASTIELANEGKGPEYLEVNFEEIAENINNMSKLIEEKKTSLGDRRNAANNAPHRPGTPRIVRVSREQAKKFVNNKPRN
jgi:small subunit ribosomal protein S2